MLSEVLGGVGERLGELGARLVLALAIGAVVVLLGRLFRPVVRRRLRRRGRPSYTRVFVGLYSAVVALVAFLLAVTAAFPSVEVADVLASLGIVSVAVGFAFKDVLENLLAGVLLLLRDPFKSGDQISVSGYQGTVEGVTVRETLLRTYDGRRVLIPNSTVFTSALEVDTHFPHVRSAFTVDLDPASDLSTARMAAGTALSGTEGVQADPHPEAVITRWTDRAITLECRYWTAADRRTRVIVLDRAIEAVRDAYAASGLHAPTDRLVIDRDTADGDGSGADRQRPR